MNILYVEDNTSDFDLLKRALSRTAPLFSIERACTCKEALMKLQTCTPEDPRYDLLLTDMELPDGEGTSLIPFLQEHNLPIAVVIITGMGSEEAAVAALKAGVSDYVAKRGDYLSRLPDILETALHRYRAATGRHPESLRILYVGHDTTDIDLMVSHFSHYAPYMRLEIVRSAQDVLKRMPSSGENYKDVQSVCDVLLIDYHLANMDGIRLLKELLEVRCLDLAVVMLAEQADKESVTQAFRLGAMDYVVKHSVYLHQLIGSLENAFHRGQLAREQKALKTSEEYFRTLIENTNDIIMVLKQDGAISYASPSYTRSLGFTLEEIVKTQALSFIHPDDQSSALESIEKTLANPDSTGPTVELRIRHKDGLWKYMEVLGKSMTDPSGQPAIVVNMRDLTLRKQAEETLLESEKRYRTAIEHSNDGVALVKGDEHIYVNQKFLDMFGYEKPEEIIGTSTYIIAHQDDRAKVLDYNRKRQRGEDVPPRYTFKGIKKDGTTLYIDVSVAATLLRGEPVTLAFLRDITESVLAEQKIIESEQSLQAILAASPIGIGRVKNRIVDWVNESMCRISGYTFEELKGKSTRILHESDEEFERVGKSLYDTGLAEHILVRKDSTRRDVFIQTSPAKSYSHIFTVTDITQQKETERALRKSEVLYRTLVETSSEILMLGNADRRRTYVSPNITSILGYSVEEFLAGDRKGFIHPDSVAPADAARLWALKHPGESVTFEARNRHKDGSWRWFECTARNLLEEPNVNSMVMNLHDITKRKEAEEALRKSESTLRSVLSASPVGIHLITPDRKIVWMNDSLTAITGYTLEDMEDRNPRILYRTDEEFVRVGKLVFEKVLQGNAVEADTQWVRKDGEIRHIHLSVAPIDPDDASLGQVSAITDITEQKRTEEALVESEEKYRAVVENSLVGFYIIQDGLFRFANKRFCEMFGYTYEEIVDKLGPVNFTDPADAKIVEENIDRRLTGRADNIEYEFRTTRKNGTVMNAKVLGSSTILNGRRAATGTIIDITREKTLESQLRQALKMEAIGTLAGGVAHDFNNILTALTGYGTLLQLKLDKENPLQRYVDQILSASMKGANLTRSLLAFSRKQPITLNPVNLNNIIKGTEKLLKRLLTEDIVLKTLLASDDMIIMADSTQIDQILFNLVTNARDAMPKGGSLSIGTKIMALDSDFIGAHGFGQPGTYALLSISDTGTGIDRTVKEHIFDPFFTTKEVGKGTGLGLSTVYGIVKQHNGYITIYSEPGIGTTVRIYLPLTSAVAHADTSSSKSTKGGKETILVAEDDEEVRDLIKNILVEFGYNIIGAKDGEEAINKYNKYKNIDLLILDSVMPKMNGRTVYDEISKRNPHIKVIFTSGYTRDVILDKGIEDKKFAFIAKPLSPKELLEKVREVLDNN